MRLEPGGKDLRDRRSPRPEAHEGVHLVDVAPDVLGIVVSRATAGSAAFSTRLALAVERSATARRRAGRSDPRRGGRSRRASSSAKVRGTRMPGSAAPPAGPGSSARRVGRDEAEVGAARCRRRAPGGRRLRKARSSASMARRAAYTATYSNSDSWRGGGASAGAEPGIVEERRRPPVGGDDEGPRARDRAADAGDVVEAQRAGAARGDDAVDRARAEAGHPQQQLARRHG